MKRTTRQTIARDCSHLVPTSFSGGNSETPLWERVVPTVPTVPPVFDQIATGCGAAGLWASGGYKKDTDILITKISRNSRNSGNNPLWMRGLSVPTSKRKWEQKAQSGNTDGKCVIFTTSCSRVKPVAPCATPKSPAWMIALSHVAPEDGSTPQTNPIQRGLASNMGAKPGVQQGQPMEPVDSKRFSSLSPQSRGLVPLVERRNARNQMPYRSERPMNGDSPLRGGYHRHRGGPFRLSVWIDGMVTSCLFNF